MNRLRASLLLTVALALCALALVAPGRALAASYRFSDVTIKASVDASGNLRVVERRTAIIRGQASYIYWDFPLKGTQGFQVNSVSGPDGPMQLIAEDQSPDLRPVGRYAVWLAGTNQDVAHVEGYFDLPKGGKPTFTLDYTIFGVAKRWSDTSELYYQFISGGWAARTDRVRISVQLPRGVTRAETKAWAHGPLNGTVRILASPSNGATTVFLDVDRLPAKTFVEGRVLFPTSALPGAQQQSEARLKSILAEEKSNADAANAKRRKALFGLIAGWVLVGLLSVGGLVLGAWLFLRYGREYKADFPGGYFREDPQPDLPPAVVGALWRMGTPGDQEVAATLMDLANRGVIHLEKATEESHGFLGIGAHEHETYVMTLDESKRGELEPLDRSLVDFLFGVVVDSGPLTIEGMKDWAKAHPEHWSQELRDWKQSAYDEAVARGFFERGGAGRIAGMIALGVVMAGVAVAVAFALGSIAIGVVGVLAAIPVFVMAPLMSRRTKAACELEAKYKGLRDYLHDFSRLNEAPPMHVILWERFLVLAVVFGIAEQVIEALRVKAPEVVNDPTFAPTYWWIASSDASGHTPISAVQAGFASASQIAHSEMSSASGGGGGFSGGGGGGIGAGGGGGIG